MTTSCIATKKEDEKTIDTYIENMNKKLALSPLIRQGNVRKYAIPCTNENLLIYSGKSWGIIDPLYMGIIVMALFGLMWGWHNFGVYFGFAIACTSFFISDTFIRILLVAGLKKLNKTITYRKVNLDEVIRLLQEGELQLPEKKVIE
jgi:hypothetical protein